MNVELLRAAWWRLPYGLEARDGRNGHLLRTEPPFAQAELTERDGLLYTRSSVGSNFFSMLQVGRIRFTGQEDPSYVSWGRKLWSESWEAKLNEQAWERVKHLPSDEQRRAVGETPEKIAAFNHESLIRATVVARRDKLHNRNNFIADGVERFAFDSDDQYTKGRK